ncbi:MAG: hypothetical protein EZS28_013573 [Streblomastix strix]|uniref:Uncharacterized protein n=1 Tax=Streblomastix strix TaxID=222440 RepID=A0A5J4W8G3_9EUKA|nr:MAG: hypothetical protein EZS28_013573 [Streblomastix strix]
MQLYIHDFEEEIKLGKGHRLLNLEYRTKEGVFQTNENHQHSGNNNAQRLGYNRRPASSFPPHQSSRRNAALPKLQLQPSLLQLQKKTVWIFVGTHSLFSMSPTSDCRGQKAMQLKNFRLYGRHFDPVIGSHNISACNPSVDVDSKRALLDDRNGQEQDHSITDNRIHGLAIEIKRNDGTNDKIPKNESIKLTKIFDGANLGKQIQKKKRFGISNWKIPIHKSTIQTRCVSHLVALQAEIQRNGQQRLEQVVQTQQECDIGYYMEDQQDGWFRTQAISTILFVKFEGPLIYKLCIQQN